MLMAASELRRSRSLAGQISSENGFIHTHRTAASPAVLQVSSKNRSDLERKQVYARAYIHTRGVGGRGIFRPPERPLRHT